MVKNVKKGIKDDFFESKTGLDFKGTPKSKLQKDHFNFINEMMKSDDTLDGKLMAHKIDKAFMEK